MGLIRTTLVGIAFCILLGMWAKAKCEGPQVIVKEVVQPMSIIQTQELLIDLGFGNPIIDGERKQLRPDNKWGIITERAMCDYEASLHF